MPMRGGWPIRVAILILSGVSARADITLLLEEPYGTFGGMNPTGHSAIYLSRVCAETPVSLRRCQPGELGAVISRYHRVGGYDWLAIPLIPYLYAVEQARDVPVEANEDMVAALRDSYRRAHLEDIIPDDPGGETPMGDWTQLVGEAYDRSMYAFTIHTTAEQDNALIERLNSRPNRVRFHLLYNNCADFARNIIDFYYPRAVHRSFSADVGIMTPKQAAKSLVHYGDRHPGADLSTFVIAQVPGTISRSSAVRGVIESLIKSKRYIVPLTGLAVLHPAVGGGLAYGIIEGSHFDPRKVAESAGARPLTAEGVYMELKAPAGGASIRALQ
jgi:hypothetical protein